MHPSSRLLLGLALALFAAGATANQSQEMSAPPSILISRQLAESRELRIGDIVRLSADRVGNGARPFRIAGVYEPTPDPMRFAQPRLEARLHLPDLIALSADPSDPASSESVTAINVELTDG